MGQEVVGDGLPSPPSGPDLAFEQILGSGFGTDRPQFNYRRIGKLPMTQIDGFAKLLWSARDHDPPSGCFRGQPLNGLTTQSVGHLVQAVQEECDTASIE
jgi:hypothetical protein